jgi:predicted DNA-binding transcriptional regulator AlpA
MTHQHLAMPEAVHRAIDRLSVDGAAHYVGLSVSFLNRARLHGDGPVFLKLGRRVVYDRTDLDNWLASRRRTSTSQEAA